MRPGFLTIAALLVMLAAAAAPAQAATTCTPDDGYLTGPRHVAGGRPVELTLQPPLLGEARDATTDVDGVTDGAAWDGPPSPVPGSPASWTISGIEGTVRFSVSYAGDDGCPQSKHIDIEAVPAQAPRPFADIATYGAENAVEIGVESGDSVTDEHASLAWLQLRGRRDGRRVRFRYALTWHGRTLRRGAIVGVTRYQAPHQVWLGTHAFVNFCINENKQTHSESGNLYCWYDGYLRRSWTITR